MPRPLDVDYLQPGEEPIVVAPRHRLSAVDGAIGLTVVLAVYLTAWALARRLLPARLDPFLVGFLVVGLAGYVVLLIALWWRVQTSRYVVTPERVYRSHGRLRFRLLQTTYDKVTDMHVRQSLFGRHWDFGDITIQTAGTGLAMDGVPDPFAMKRRIEEARSSFINTLVGERLAEGAAATMEQGAIAPEPRDAGAPVPRRGAPALWQGGPTLASVLPAVIPGVFMALAAVALGTGSLALREPTMLFIAGGLILFGFLSLVGAIIQYRYTRYEVADWGVVVTSGWLSRKRVEATYNKVTDITTHQGLLGRLFDFGNITINTAGSNEAPVVFSGLARPENVKQILDAARENADRTRRRPR